jgi:hypothetical protein
MGCSVSVMSHGNAKRKSSTSSRDHKADEMITPSIPEKENSILTLSHKCV